MTNDILQKRTLALTLALLLLIAALISADLWTDYQAGTTAGHIAVEMVILLLAAAGVVMLWSAYRDARETLADLRVDIAAARLEAARWRDNAKPTIDQFRSAIEGQFVKWNLTAAERDVSMCLLRGLSHKEVASRRKTSERTVREQARSVYVKSGVGGRSELAAFFLADLTSGDTRHDTDGDAEDVRP